MPRKSNNPMRYGLSLMIMIGFMYVIMNPDILNVRSPTEITELPENKICELNDSGVMMECIRMTSGEAKPRQNIQSISSDDYTTSNFGLIATIITIGVLALAGVMIIWLLIKFNIIGFTKNNSKSNQT